MLMFTTALLVLQMLTAAPAAYEPCSEAPGTQECGSGLLCDGGLCLPTQDCETAQDCPVAPEAYSVVCAVTLTCEGSWGQCLLAPGQYEECPEGLVNTVHSSGIEVCVKS
jgi:hypothetical protein